MTGVIAGMLLSQGGFARSVGGMNDDAAYSMSRTSDAGFTLAGFTESWGAGQEDIMVIKLNPNGEIAWARAIGGADQDEGYAVTGTSDGGIVVAAYTESFGHENDFLILKLNSSGGMAWAKAIGGTAVDCPYAIAVTADGGIAVLGETFSSGQGYNDFLIVKLAPDGSLSWARTVGATSWDHGFSIAPTADTGVVVTGYTMSWGTGGGELIVAKIDKTGSLEWAKIYEDPSANFDEAYSVIQTSDRGFAVAGYTVYFGSGGRQDFIVMKLDSDGNPSWVKAYGGNSDDNANSIIQTSDSGFAVAGYTRSYGVGSRDFMIIRLNKNGDLIWARTWGRTGKDEAKSIIQAQDGGFVAAGYIDGFSSYYDFAALKLGPDGNYPGCVSECVPVVNTASPIVYPANGLVCAEYVPDVSAPEPIVTTINPATVNICDPLYEGVNETQEGVHEVISLPISGGIIFRSTRSLALKIYGPDGRVAYSGNLIPGENRVSMRPGVYFWRAESFGGRITVR
ncbi:MAG: hypothetical protein ABIN66_07785 [candidate division WOR-3 bacterium]